jgi:hypothetical protein
MKFNAYLINYIHKINAKNLNIMNAMIEMIVKKQKLFINLNRE